MSGATAAPAIALGSPRLLNAKERDLLLLASLPPATPENDRFIPRARVEQITGLRKTRLYEMIDEGTFPEPYKPGGSGSRWSEAEVRAWVAGVKERRAA